MKKQSRIQTEAWMNLGAFVVMTAVNTLANILPIAGRTTGQVSAAYPTLFTPAPYTFSIWGLIYTSLGIFIIQRLAVSARHPERPTKIWFALSCLLNVFWIIAWHYKLIPLTLGLMLLLLGTLMALYTQLDIGRSGLPWKRKGFHIPVSIYLGWISVATIANAAVYLVSTRVMNLGLTPEIWTALMIGAAVILGFAFLFFRRDPFAALVFLWALIGILVKRLGAPGTPSPIILGALISGISLMTLGILVQGIRKRVY